ncbi:MAG: selenocysteine-specific translation elongation factor [Halanaerobiales bacterium]|nr:selenocysteine-specific translation elongation factor [Halanaerobiales bacterium]
MSFKNFIIGTAGHIDHGKTTLIKALSGTDTDRLSEEKRRGISIDLGFTDLKLNDKYTLGIVDVPGHEKFIKNMLAGAGGVDIALLVIAADEGVMPQTREHLDILSLLNVKKGIIVVTKIDLVEEEWLDLMIEEIKGELSDTFLNSSLIVPVSSIENEGIGLLKNELIDLIQESKEKEISGNVYFPIDRVFTIKGHGTIVTGTLVNGKINVEDSLKIYPAHKEVRVRNIEVHNKEADCACPGQRVGINLTNIEKDEIKRGDVLATPDSLINTRYLNGRLKVLKNTQLIVEHGDRVRFHIGAKEVMGRVYLLDKKELLPGESGFVQYRLEEELVAHFNENYVIRRYSPMNTIGGGNILDTHPTRKNRFKEDIDTILEKLEKFNDQKRVEYLIELNEKETVTYDYLIKKSSMRKEKIKEILKRLEKDYKIISLSKGTKNSWIHIKNYKKLKDEILNKVNQFHQQNKLKYGISSEELRTQLSITINNKDYNQVLNDLIENKKVELKNSKVKDFDYEIVLSSKEKEIKDQIITTFQNNLFSPPNIEQFLDQNIKKEEVFEYLVDSNTLILLNNDIYFLNIAIKKAEDILREYFKKNNTITLAKYRDLLNSSRKYTLALLEYFDQKGITKRKGEERILIK